MKLLAYTDKEAYCVVSSAEFRMLTGRGLSVTPPGTEFSLKAFTDAITSLKQQPQLIEDAKLHAEQLLASMTALAERAKAEPTEPDVKG